MFCNKTVQQVWCVGRSPGVLCAAFCLLGRVLSSIWVGMITEPTVVHQVLPDCKYTCGKYCCKVCVCVCNISISQGSLVCTYMFVCTVPPFSRCESSWQECVLGCCVAWNARWVFVTRSVVRAVSMSIVGQGKVLWAVASQQGVEDSVRKDGVFIIHH